MFHLLSDITLKLYTSKSNRVTHLSYICQCTIRQIDRICSLILSIIFNSVCLTIINFRLIVNFLSVQGMNYFCSLNKIELTNNSGIGLGKMVLNV